MLKSVRVPELTLPPTVIGLMAPKINGQNKTYLLNQMKDIKSGARANGMSMAMKAMVANVSDAELEAIADYLSKVK